MSRFDLGNTVDFSRITQQSIQDIIALSGGDDPSKWAIQEASYNGVLFHVFKTATGYQAALRQVQDFTGRRKVKYIYPYRDGQTTDDLGRKPATFDCDILLHGPRYLDALQLLLAEFDKPQPGTLVHPVRGKIICAVEDVQLTHSSEQRKAVTLRVTFIEHNFTIGDLSGLSRETVKSSLSKALDVFRKVDAVINKVNATVLFARGLKNRLIALADAYKNALGTILTNCNLAFNSGGSAEIPTLLPVNRGGTRNPDGSLSDDTFVLARTVSDPFNEVPASLLDTPAASFVAAQEIQKQIASSREQVDEIIETISANGGDLEFYDEVQQLRETVVQVQEVFETGVQSSSAQVIDYVTPRVMSIREVAFANGITPDRMPELDVLNPALLSLNHIEAGVTVKVPVS